MTNENEYSISIDFGTSNLKVACFDSTKGMDDLSKIDLVNMSFEQTSKIIPNIINIGSDGIRIGEMGEVGSETSVRGLKRQIEEENWSMFIPQRNKEMKVSEILTEEFSWIKKYIEYTFATNISKTVLTVPVSFSEKQKNRLKNAAEKAGLDVAYVLTEPFAGMFSYYEFLENKSENADDEPLFMLVFDFGGGTLDLCLFRVDIDETMEISACASIGINFGGENITELLIDNLIMKQYKSYFDDAVQKIFKHRFLDSAFISDEDKKPDSELYKSNYKTSYDYIYNKLFSEINSFKEKHICIKNSMTRDCDEEMIFNSSTIDEIKNVPLSYNGFVKLIEGAGIKEKIADAVEFLCEKGMIEASWIKKVILIGGTTKILYFQNLISELLETPDEEKADLFITHKKKDGEYSAVANGAMIYYKYNNVKFDAENILPYEIGTIYDGKYVLLRTSATPLDNYSIKKSVIPEKCRGFYKLKMYQIFDSLDYLKDKSDPLSRVIYMGYFRIEPEQMPDNGRCLIELMINSECELSANIYDSSGKKLLLENTGLIYEGD